MKPEWNTKHTIRSYDADPQLTARLPVLCRFMQEAAYRHAENLGMGYSDLLEKQYAWVLARQRIEVSRLPKWDDSVNIRTWPSGRDRLFFYRDFEIIDGEGHLILQARTAWFMIDVQRRERVSSDFYLTSELPKVGTPVFVAKPARLKTCACEGVGQDVTVNYGDLDMNGHVNNVRYIEWLLNSLPLEFHRSHTIHTLDVNYLAEAMYGHTVSIRSGETASGALEHGVFADGSELLRARSVWQSCIEF